MDGTARVVTVLTEVAPLSKAFDYAVPDGFAGPLELGARVRVNLHGRSVRGWIVGFGGEHDSGATLKEIRSSLGIGPSPAVVELCRWAAWRWSGSVSKFLAAASPDTIVRALPHRPSPAPVVEADSALDELGRGLCETPGPSLVRVGPAQDPFDLLLGVVSATSSGPHAEGSLLILVPGRGYAERLTTRLRSRGLDAVDLADGWAEARAGWPIVVGTRSAAFAPVPGVRGVVVFDADDERFVSEAAPTWDATVVAIERGTRARVPVIMVASCPSPTLSVRTRAVEVDRAAERDGWPKITVVDRSEEDPRNGWLSHELVTQARAALEEQPDGIAVAALINRTGRAKLLICSRCDQVARCEACDAAIGLLDDALVCPRCETRRPVICAACGAIKLKRLRPGTAQLTDELAALLGCPVVELTATTDPGALDGARAVVGTEAILHRIRRTRLVALLDLDHHLLAPYAGAERHALALIGRAGRLVGARRLPTSGQVLVQTRVPDHVVVTAAIAGDPAPVLEAEAQLRAALELPPSVAMASIAGKGAPEMVGPLEGEGLTVRPQSDGSFVVVGSDPTALCDALGAVDRPRDVVRVSVEPEGLR